MHNLYIKPELASNTSLNCVVFSFEVKLPEIFQDLHATYEKIDARLKAEQFKVSLSRMTLTCFRVFILCSCILLYEDFPSKYG